MRLVGDWTHRAPLQTRTINAFPLAAFAALSSSDMVLERRRPSLEYELKE